jgi:hypothetical protein
MLIDPVNRARLKKFGLEVFTKVDLLYMAEDAGEDWNYSYRNMLRNFRHFKPDLFLETMEVLTECISCCADRSNILSIVAKTLAYSGVQTEYVNRTPLEYLQWVLDEMKDEWEHPSYDPMVPFGRMRELD